MVVGGSGTVQLQPEHCSHHAIHQETFNCVFMGLYMHTCILKCLNNLTCSFGIYFFFCLVSGGFWETRIKCMYMTVECPQTHS